MSNGLIAPSVCGTHGPFMGIGRTAAARMRRFVAWSERHRNMGSRSRNFSNGRRQSGLASDTRLASTSSLPRPFQGAPHRTSHDDRSDAQTLRARLRWPAVAAAASLLAAPGLSAQTASTDKVVAKVDGMPITEKDLDIAAEDVAGKPAAQITDAQKRDYLVGYVVRPEARRPRSRARPSWTPIPTSSARLAFFTRQAAARRLPRRGGQEGGHARGHAEALRRHPSRASRPSRRRAPATSSSRRKTRRRPSWPG